MRKRPRDEEMHEMAIAQSVLEVAFAEAEKHSSPAVRKIKLRIGEMSGVVGDAVEFAFDVLRKDTPAAGAELEIETVGLAAECASCGESECSSTDLNLICRTCGRTLQITSGREMQIEYIDLV